MKKVIITGATGTIGISLINELVARNIEVLVFTRKESKRNNRIPTNPLVKIKYCSLDELKNVENDTGNTYDVFFHMAWAGASGVERNDMYLQEKNIHYSLDAVGVAKRFGCKLFIGAGSQAEYGRFDKKLTPTTPAFPEMGYGYAKLCAGQMTRDYAHQLGLEHIWVRILSVYGPYDGEKSMIMTAINKMRMGAEIQVTKGEQRWDYLYSGDAAKALILIGERGHDGKIYVLGSGHTNSIRDYVEIIHNIVNSESEIKYGAIPYSVKQVMYLCADITELQKDTNWFPKTKFEEGIKQILKSL